MEFLELATSRYSVRDFSPKPMEEEKIGKILEAAKVAPTAVNFQPQKLYVIKSPAAIERLAAIRPLFGAPMAVIVCYDDTISWKNSRDGGRRLPGHHTPQWITCRLSGRIVRRLS